MSRYVPTPLLTVYKLHRYQPPGIVPQKLNKRYLAAPTESANLQDLVRNELKAKSHTASEGLLWLVR